ncbi:anti-sigma factor domain-containing protein [Herbivorax sp. ANBcel31]|uniref:anti-sigma-I factor RsgI family protein n=1 Tax=Herbivorax sp. ANBcel31 TaxID=3069754 RepID=UPI0027B42E46|nr:anti-sigma factor domain-containing protein [Herbivorax sp. ANBcel31]MDQ2088057.1 anti-sigma factor domain-containing protein [Herbivorax sp. ANBcel31]
MKKEGVVLEFSKNKAIIINSENRYIMIKRKPDMLVGEVVEYEVFEEIKNKKVAGIASTVAAISAIIVVAFLLYNNISIEKKTYAFIDIDINPSIELRIDQDNRVLKSYYFNESAKELLKEMELDGLSVNEAVGLIVEKSEREGLIQLNQEDVVYVSAALNEDADIKYDKELLNVILKNIEINLNNLYNRKIQVKTKSVACELRKNARENNISMGKYSLFYEAVEEGLEITIEEVRQTPIRETMERIEKRKMIEENKRIEEKQRREENKRTEEIKEENKEKKDSQGKEEIQKREESQRKEENRRKEESQKREKSQRREETLNFFNTPT